MKQLILIWFCIIISNTSFAQFREAIEIDMTRYHNAVHRLNKLHNIKICDCQEGRNAYYLYSFTFAVVMIDTTYYPTHFIASIEFDQKKKNKKAIIYEVSPEKDTISRTALSSLRKDTIPRSGWLSFFASMDSIDLDSIPNHFFEIPNVLLTGPDGMQSIFFHCKDGSLRPHIILKSLERYMDFNTIPEDYQEAGRQLARSRRLFELFYSEFASIIGW